MPFLRGRGLAALLLALALIGGACGDDNGDADVGVGDDAEGSCAGFEIDESIVVGGTNFSEQEIVAELYAQCLEAAGADVTKKLKLGSREIVLPALESGEIDLYPEYVGTSLTFLKGEPSPDLDESLAALREKFGAKDIAVLEPAPAEDKNGFAVTQETAVRYGLEKVSDLEPVAGELVLGAPPECPERPLCAIGLKETYGIEFAEIRKLDAGGPLTKDALENGDIDVGLLFTSDGAVTARGFVMLEDDKKLQPVENVVPVIREDVVNDDIEALLNSISENLTTEELSEMNKQVDVDKEDPADVAEAWLRENGYVA
jgi:osmoprotectant transport system substrate-binding protein